MSTEVSMPEFDQLADLFWRLGVMQAPSHLHGYLVGLLAVGDGIEPAQWLALATKLIDPVEELTAEDGRLLLSVYGATFGAMTQGNLDLQLLLPEDGAEIGQRADCLGQWCQGFMAGFAQAGKALKQQEGQQQYSTDVAEALSDIAAISQISLEDEEADMEQSEQSLFEIAEYLRLAAITVYLECHKPEGEPAPVVLSSVKDEETVASPANLFSKSGNKLH
ncbi:MAG: yecA family protein [Oceanicoccus sp.]|jgi:yecA family protein